MHVLRSIIVVLVVLGAAAGCGSPGCPAGSEEVGGRCIVADAGPADDARAHDADGSLDGGDPGPDATACAERVWYEDRDGDGHGDEESSVTGGCDAPEGHVAQGGDCDDSSASVHPDAAELCDGLDDDCDGTIDEGLSPVIDFFVDADGDGHGAGGAVGRACAPPPGHSSLDDDCDDARATIHPEAVEVCDGLDDDCDGVADDGLQRLIGAPIEVVARGTAEDPVAAIPLGAEYGVVWFSSSAGLVAGRIGPDGVRLDAGVSVSTSSMHDGRVVMAPAGAGRAVVAWGERVSASENVLRARLVTFGTPIVLGTAVEVTTEIDASGPIAATSTGARIALAWRTSFAHVNGRTYDADLGAPAAVRTLYTFSVGSLQLLAIPGETEFVLSLWTAQRSGDTSPQGYADRIQISPLTIESRYARLGDGRRVGAVRGAVMAGERSTPEIGAVVVYDAAAELVRFAPGAFGTVIAVGSRAALDTGEGSLRGVSLSAAAEHWDIGASVLSGSVAAVSWAHAEGSSAPSAGTAIGPSHFVAGASAVRLSPSRGAIFWVSTATASTPPSSLWMQRIGCE